ncbi:MAG: DUF484 family protein [Pseudomonadota bacterium]
MSSQLKATPAPELPDEASVVAYLRTHPDFFDHHRQLLTALRLPHVSGGGTVSLVERQVATLRQKNHRLDRKLKELVEVARANEALATKVHKLALELLAATTLGGTLTTLERNLRTGFAADQSLIVLYSELSGFDALPKQRFVRVVSRTAAELRPFETFLGGGRARCGQVRDSQRDFLFGKDTDEIGSAALIPLGDQASLGFMAIGSANSEHFHPTMSIDFLTRIGELVTGALERGRNHSAAA